MNGSNYIQGQLAPRKDSLAIFVFQCQSTELDVRFHSTCIPPRVLLHNIDHMAVQIMSIAVECVVLVSKLRIHHDVHTLNVSHGADIT